MHFSHQRNKKHESGWEKIKSKIEIIKLARRLNVDLKSTITCYQPNEATECGVCLSCVTKRKALENA